MRCAKSCDSCKTGGALLFCRTHSAFLCMSCDGKIHVNTRHERVWMCEVCEQAPASVTCKADAAALCVTCDRDIHSANPLARRHERIPVVPFFDCAETVVKSTATTFLLSNTVTNDDHSSNWILPTGKLSGDVISPDIKSIELLLSETGQLLDFDYGTPPDPPIQSQFHNSGTDSVVPVQSAQPLLINHSPQEKHFEIDFTRSNINSYNNSYNTPSLSHSLSSSSMDVGVVPDHANSMSDISYPFVLQMNNGTIDHHQATQLSSTDRKARVMRYREKRKNRKFEKTIRYASRKAYAETRPRIKGRFAKRTEADVDVDPWFTGAGGGSTLAFVGEAEYGVVPSF